MKGETSGTLVTEMLGDPQVETVYNDSRPHGTIHYKTPSGFEAAYLEINQ